MRTLIELFFGSEEPEPAPEALPVPPELGILDQSRQAVSDSLVALSKHEALVERQIEECHRRTAGLEARRMEIVKAKEVFSDAAAKLDETPQLPAIDDATAEQAIEAALDEINLVADEYDSDDDAKKSYDLAIQVKRERGDKHWPAPKSSKRRKADAEAA